MHALTWGDTVTAPLPLCCTNLISLCYWQLYIYKYKLAIFNSRLVKNVWPLISCCLWLRQSRSMVAISSLCCWMIFFRALSSSCCCFCRNSCSCGKDWIRGRREWKDGQTTALISTLNFRMATQPIANYHKNISHKKQVKTPAQTVVLFEKAWRKEAKQNY